MSERAEYPVGVPCWVDAMVPDPVAAQAFYGPLFGWEFEARGTYAVARLEGLDVAGVGELPAPSWNTYVRVDRVEDAVERATAAGGTVAVGARDALPAGRFAVLLDPGGAAIGVWEPHERAGAQLVNAPDTWTMSSLHVGAPAAVTAFYRALFGWEPEPFGPLTLLRVPGYVGGEEGQPVPRDVVAVLAPPSGTVPPHWNVNFRVADADAMIDHAPRLGGSLLMGPIDTPGLRSAVISDPQGAVFSISQLVLAPML